MDRITDAKLNQYLTEFSKEATELDKEMREATTIEKEKPIKSRKGHIDAIVNRLYAIRTAIRKEKEKEV